MLHQEKKKKGEKNKRKRKKEEGMVWASELPPQAWGWSSHPKY